LIGFRPSSSSPSALLTGTNSRPRRYTLADIFEALEAGKAALGIESYQLCQSDLEDVFLNITQSRSSREGAGAGAGAGRDPGGEWELDAVKGGTGACKNVGRARLAVTKEDEREDDVAVAGEVEVAGGFMDGARAYKFEGATGFNAGPGKFRFKGKSGWDEGSTWVLRVTGDDAAKLLITEGYGKGSKVYLKRAGGGGGGF
jgi:hypothetical protein